MPNLSSIAIKLTDAAGKTTTTKAELLQWTKHDARGKAMRWAGVIFLICLAMLPIPGVHFAIIPVLLVGLPVALFAVYKMYSDGTDLRAKAVCPTCGATTDVMKSVDDWPIQMNCKACRAQFQVDKVDS